MTDTRHEFRFFTLFDYDLEEEWLRNMNAQGWRVTDVTLTFYTFERCEPEDVVYKMDFCEVTGNEKTNYLSMFKEYGWEFVYEVNSYCCFRRPSKGISQKDLDIFSDTGSKFEMMKRIIKWRLIPILIIFMAAVVPNCLRILSRDGYSDLFTPIAFGVMFGLYLIIFTKIITGYFRVKKNTETGTDTINITEKKIR